MSPFRRPVALVAVWALLGGALSAGSGSAQEAPPGATPEIVGGAVLVRVDDVAGTTVYVNAGRGLGFEAGDTFSVAVEGSTETAELTVLSAAENRSVMSFSSRPVPLTRGANIRLTPIGQAATKLAQQWGPSTTRPTDAAVGFEIARSRLPIPPQAAQGVPLEFQGRAYFDVSAMRSETLWDGEGAAPGNLTRIFATPSLRVNGTVSNLPGDVRVRTSLRSAYRYSDPSVVNAQAIRVYEMAAEGTALGGEFRLGRFFSPFEDYSGYWDGAMVRFGRGRFGGGAAVGLQPDRFNEGLSTDIRKITGFVDYRVATDNASWSGDLSVHRTQSEIGLPDHTFLGWSQDGRFGRLRLSQDVQVDEDPDTGDWVVSRVQIGGVVPVTQRVYVHGRYSRRQPYSIYRDTDVFSTLRSNPGVGLSYSAGWGSASADVGRGSLDGIGDSKNLSGSVLFRTPFGLGADLGASASYWTREDSNVLSVAPSITRLFGSIRGRATYRFYYSDSPFSQLRTHGGDVTVSLPLRAGWNWSIQTMGNWGNNLRTYRFHTGLSVAFR